MHKLDVELLVALQDDFPLAAHPYRVIAERLGSDEEVVFSRLREFVRRGLLRRLGPRYSSRRLGMRSTLSAARIAPENLIGVTTFLAGLPQVTHCYERAGSSYNLWFTLSARSEEWIARILSDLRGRAGVMEVHNLPAERVYKLRVRFVPTQADDIAVPAVRLIEEGVPSVLDETDRQIVSATQGGLPSALTPYAEVAETLGLTVEELLSRLRVLCETGVIRTMGAVLDGPALGYRGNALVAWKVSDEDCDRAGIRFAGFDEVSHCYRRPALANFPYTLYTMVHGIDAADCERIVRGMSERAGLDAFVMLPTVGEFKKTAAVYFEPDENES